MYRGPDCFDQVARTRSVIAFPRSPEASIDSSFRDFGIRKGGCFVLRRSIDEAEVAKWYMCIAYCLTNELAQETWSTPLMT